MRDERLYPRKFWLQDGTWSIRAVAICNCASRTLLARGPEGGVCACGGAILSQEELGLEFKAPLVFNPPMAHRGTFVPDKEAKDAVLEVAVALTAPKEPAPPRVRVGRRPSSWDGGTAKGGGEHEPHLVGTPWKGMTLKVCGARKKETADTSPVRPWVFLEVGKVVVRMSPEKAQSLAGAIMAHAYAQQEAESEEYGFNVEVWEA